MKIKQIKYGMRKGKPDAEFGRTPVPKKITVELSLAEITYLSKLIGKQSHVTANQIVPDIGAGGINSEIYGVCCEVLNPCFYDGDDDAVRYVQRRRKS